MAPDTAAPLRHVANQHGVVFHVRVVLQGEHWGAGDTLVHDREDPLVEFFDTRFPEKFGDLGQFVSRYYLSTLDDSAKALGLQLYGGVPEWTLTPSNVVAAIEFAQERVAEAFNPQAEALRLGTVLGQFEDHNDDCEFANGKGVTCTC